MTDSPKHKIEALLFSSGKTMTVQQIADLAKLDKAKVTRALKALQKDYQDRDSAITVYSLDEGWKMGVVDEYLSLVRGIVADTEISRATMETLAVIAYKYPAALQSSVVDTRGGNAYEHIKDLEQLGFVKKEPLGRSFKLKLTDKFFEYFDIAGADDIRKVFKNVKPPEIETQKKLGEMDVVDDLTPRPSGPAGELEVVDVSDEPERPVVEDEPVQRPVRVEKTAEELTAHQKFLDDLDKKIDAIGKKMDAHDDDPLLRRTAPEDEDSADGISDEDHKEEEQ